MRRFLTPGWLGLHALALVLFSAFLLAGWWQLQRAGEGNDRSWAYAFEWPLFAVFVVAMWVKMIRDERAPGSGEGSASAGEQRTQSEAARIEVEDDPDLAAYNRYLARLDAQSRQRS